MSVITMLVFLVCGYDKNSSYPHTRNAEFIEFYNLNDFCNFSKT